MTKYYLDNIYRINYCCRNIDIPKVFKEKSDDVILFLNESCYFKNDTLKYSEYLKNLLNFVLISNIRQSNENIKFKYFPEDCVKLFQDSPTLVKSRMITNNPKYSILLKLDINRHFAPIYNVVEVDIPFEKKKNSLVWRGVTTGYGFDDSDQDLHPTSRQNLVERYCFHPNKNIDIGYSGLTQAAKLKKSYYGQFLKNQMSMRQLLEYKYILSVEGNDVASNLKWLLASNSVVFMPKPYIESWILESHLKPYYHYIPVANDFSDLQIQLKWCNEHQKECKQIVKNANEYMKMFLDEENEKQIISSILEKYVRNVRFEE